MQHDLNIPHTAKWDKNKCHICYITFKEIELFKSHMMNHHSFTDDSNEWMTCESIEVGLYLQMPKQYVSMNCKDCEHEEEENDLYTLTCV